MKSLPIRVASAVAALILFAAVAYFGGVPGIFGLSALICIVGIYEFFQMGYKILGPSVPVELKFGLALTGPIFAFLIMAQLHLIILSAVLVTLFIGYTLMLFRKNSGETYPRSLILNITGINVVGVFYTAVLPACALQLLKFDQYALEWFCYLLVVVFCGDIFAYFAGNFFGKRKLLEPVSPNKSVEGAIGGVIGSVLAGAVFTYYFLPTMPVLVMAVASAAAAVLAQLGDLFESLVKRLADVKDSGRIMPGHGGVLDRLDGVYFAAPLVYAVSQWPGFGN